MRWLYGVDYIHALIGFSIYPGPNLHNKRTLVYHSTGKGVHVLDWDTSAASGRIIKGMWEINLGEEGYNFFVQEAFRESNKSYSNRQLYGMAIAKLLRLKKLPFGANRDAEHVCSETAGRMVVKYTGFGWQGKDPDLFTPKDFFDLCESLEAKGEAKRIV